MILSANWRDARVQISLKSNCLTIGIEQPHGTDVVSYDFAGRLWSAFLNGVAYRRGLDGKLLAKWRSGCRERRWLTGEDALRIEQQAHDLVTRLYEDIRSGELHQLPTLAQVVFERILTFDVERSKADAQRFRQIYHPIGILPPDQYMAVVLQMTEGCSFNTCTFCDFYIERPFRVKSPDEFRAHALAVRHFLGDGLSLRRGIFLGDANALVLPMRRLLPLIDIVHEVYDVDALGGMYAFLDGFSGEKKSEADYRTLAERGLKRVYIGMESGSAELLRFLNKPGKPEDVAQTVRALKGAGVAVGVIVLLGAGGERYADQHVRETIDLLNTMPLDGDDILYFSELIVHERLPYARHAVDAGILPLSSDGCHAQGEAIEAGLRFQSKRPRISRYNIREFIY